MQKFIAGGSTMQYNYTSLPASCTTASTLVYEIIPLSFTSTVAIHLRAMTLAGGEEDTREWKIKGKVEK